MTRADLLAYVTGTYGALATAAGVPATDDMAGYKATLDGALRAVGVPESTLPAALVADPWAEDLLALVDYHALRRLARALAVQVDIRADQPALQKRRSQAFTQAKLLLDDAATEIARRGYGPGATMFGLLGLDFVEPAAAGGDW